tara:strand:- start:873 stop:1061 length:189 start_codon:yes stop_codon:yes gene_type:complete
LACPKLTDKMKKIFIVLCMVILNSAFISCNPENLAEEEVELQACCSDGEDIPPPPPPPPTGN